MPCVLWRSGCFSCSSIKVELSPRDTIVSTAADTTSVDIQTGYGQWCGPLTVYLWSQKIEDSIQLSVYYDIAGDVAGTGWFLLDSTLVAADIAGAGETKILLDTLIVTDVRFSNMRVRVVGGANNDKTAGSIVEIDAIGQRCR